MILLCIVNKGKVLSMVLPVMSENIKAHATEHLPNVLRMISFVRHDLWSRAHSASAHLKMDIMPNNSRYTKWQK